jgi:hypothetical protein
MVSFKVGDRVQRIGVLVPSWMKIEGDGRLLFE